MIGIIDYDAGNLRSVEKALVSLGEEVIVSRDSSEILQADKVILPGVGSFGDAMNNLDKAGKYTLSRPFVMATKGSVSSQSELVQTWFNFVKSDAGKKVIKGVGLILPE